jgi:hypothetical protein
MARKQFSLVVPLGPFITLDRSCARYHHPTFFSSIDKPVFVRLHTFHCHLSVRSAPARTIQDPRVSGLERRGMHPTPIALEVVRRLGSAAEQCGGILEATGTKVRTPSLC